MRYLADIFICQFGSILKRHRKTFLILTFIAGLTTSAHALEEAIVAVVNSDIITLQDLKVYVNQTYVSLMTQGMDEAHLQQIMQDLEINGVNKLIEDKLMLGEANKLGIIVRDKLVDDRIEEIKKNYANENDFMEALVRNGATISDLRNKILDEFKIKYLIESQVRNKIFVNPQEVTQYYEANIDKFSRKERIKLDAIYLPLRDNRLQAQEKAQEALNAIKGGKDFSDAMQEYSAPTTFGAVERGQLKPDIEDKLFLLAVGQTSDIIEVPDGFYIFLITAKTPATQAPLEEVRDVVYNMVFRDKLQKKFAEYLEKLKKKAYIEIRQ